MKHVLEHGLERGRAAQLGFQFLQKPGLGERPPELTRVDLGSRKPMLHGQDSVGSHHMGGAPESPCFLWPMLLLHLALKHFLPTRAKPTPVLGRCCTQRASLRQCKRCFPSTSGRRRFSQETSSWAALTGCFPLLPPSKAQHPAQFNARCSSPRRCRLTAATCPRSSRPSPRSSTPPPLLPHGGQCGHTPCWEPQPQTHHLLHQEERTDDLPAHLQLPALAGSCRQGRA